MPGVSLAIVVGLVVSLDGIDPAELDRDGVHESLSAVARVRAWLDAKQAELIRRLNDLAEQSPGTQVQSDIAAATRGNRADADLALKRAVALAMVPALEQALAAGDISAAHVDVLGHALG